MNRLKFLVALVAVVLASAAKGEAVLPASQSSRSPRPQALVILADLTSVTGSPRNVGELRGAIAGAIRSVLGGSDLLAIGSFTGRTRIPGLLTPAKENLNAALDGAFDVPWDERFGNCLIWDALIQAVDLLDAVPVGTRRRVVLFTAGRGSGNLATPEDVERKARAAGVEVSVVFRPSYTRPMEQKDSREAIVVMPELPLKNLVKATGGTFAESRARDEMSLTAMFESILRRK